MGTIRDAFNAAFPDGPSSSPAQPRKDDIRRAGALIDSSIESLSSGVQEALAQSNGVWVPFSSETAMNADLNYPDRTEARVYEDDTIKVYRKVGASGTGSWAYVGEIDASGFATELDAARRAYAYQGQLMPPKFVMIGDSIIQENNIVAGTFVAGYAVGEVEAAQSMLGWTLNYAVWRDDDRTPPFDGSNQGVSGNTTTQVLARLNNAILLGGSIVLLAVGTNNLVLTSDTEASIKADLQQIVDRLLSSGASKVIVGTIRPLGVGTLAADSPRRPLRVSINGWIRSDLSKLPNVVLADLASGYEDTANPVPGVAGDYYPKANSLRDDTHPTEFGAWTCGAPVLMEVFKRVSAPYKAYMPADVDNRLVSSPFVGTGGIVGARCSGQLPDNMRAGLGAGSSTALFVLQDAIREEYKAGGAGKLIACGITPIGSAAYEQIFIDQPSVIDATPLKGKWIYGWVDIEYQAWNGWGNFCLLLNDQSGNTRLAANAAYGSLATVRMPTGRTFMRLKTPYLLVPADGSVTSLGPLLQVTFHPTLDGNPGYFNIEGWRIGEVQDPRKLFNRA